jgi:phospholipid/cholesterol/gamma-HCH transport system substrate-binding protein
MSPTKVRAILRQYAWVLVTVGLYMVAATAVAAYILDNVRFRWPWTDIMHVQAEFQHAQAVTPGQGQQVTVAGVEVGEVGEVTLEDGKAIVTLDLKPEEVGPVYRNATVLLRPRTLAQDQSVALDPGSPQPGLPDRGRLDDGDRLGSEASQVNVNTDEVFAALDVDTRRALNILLDAGGDGLGDRGPDLRALLKAGQPTLKQARRLGEALAARRLELRRLVSNVRKLSEATAAKDQELASLVENSAATFDAIGSREADLAAAVERLPGALSATRSALADSRTLAREASPALEELRPVVRRLVPALEGSQPLLRTATPILRRQLRPLVRETTPLLRELRPALGDLNRATPDLVRVGRVLNYLVNELGYNPPGPDEGYLFYAAWFAHNTGSVTSVEDAHGAVVRGLVQFGCSSVGTVAPELLPVILQLNQASGVCS